MDFTAEEFDGDHLILRLKDRDASVRAHFDADPAVANTDYQPIHPLKITPIKGYGRFFGYKYEILFKKTKSLELNKSIDTDVYEPFLTEVIQNLVDDSQCFWGLGIPTPLFYRDDIPPRSYIETSSGSLFRYETRVTYVQHPNRPDIVCRHGVSLIQKTRLPGTDKKFLSFGKYIYIQYHYGRLVYLIVQGEARHFINRLVISFDGNGYPRIVCTQDQKNSQIQSYYQSCYYFDGPLMKSITLRNQVEGAFLKFTLNQDVKGIWYDKLVGEDTNNKFNFSGRLIDNLQMEPKALFVMMEKKSLTNGTYRIENKKKSVDKFYNNGLLEGPSIDIKKKDKPIVTWYFDDQMVPSREYLRLFIGRYNTLRMMPDVIIKLIFSYSLPEDYIHYLNRISGFIPPEEINIIFEILKLIK